MAAKKKTPKSRVEVDAGQKTRISKKGKKIKVTLGKKAIIALVVIVLIAAIALTAFYFAAPDKFKKLFGIGGALPPTDLKGQILEVRFLDVGQGDCIVIKFPDGKNMIIDCGGSTTSKEEKPWDKINRTLKNELNISVFDYALLTHTDADHSGYFDDILQNFDVKAVYLPDFDGNTDGSQKGTPGKIPTATFGKVVDAANAETYIQDNQTKRASVIKNLDTLTIADNGLYKITAYCRSQDYYDTVDYDAHKLNSVSPVVLVEYASRTLVFTGDGEGNGDNDAEHWFIQKNIDLDCDVLKVGHHGSSAGTTKDFLDYIDPEYAVISCGVDNKYGHPTADNLQRLSEYRDVRPDGDFNGIAHVYRTDKDGDVLLRVGSEGGGMQFDTQTEQPAPETSALRFEKFYAFPVQKQNAA